ncbi:MAG: 30S ribosomal protein S2 [Chlamydiia bacterium]|nr:30S ribosomal protein S2 [Chlamydiia bacterium]
MGQTQLSIKDLLEAGAHFGHQKRRWNPKMRRFIFEARNGLYIIDLAKTLQAIRDTLDVVAKCVRDKKSILFVGTKKQAKEVIRGCAEECGEFYVSERWLGGMLTNMSTIRNSIKTLDRIEKKLAAGGGGLTKKELSLLAKEQIKLERNLSGIRGMRKLPGLLIVVDPSQEHIAVAEANKLDIPVVALIDTNCNPDPITYPIPSNDDALKSVKVIVKELTRVVIDQKKAMNLSFGVDMEEAKEKMGLQKDKSAIKETIEPMEASQ